MAGTKKAAWCFTSHDVSEDYKAKLAALDCKYIVYGFECALPLVVLTSKATWSSRLRDTSLPSRSCCPARTSAPQGTSEQAADYCNKTELHGARRDLRTRQAQRSQGRGGYDCGRRQPRAHHRQHHLLPGDQDGDDDPPDQEPKRDFKPTSNGSTARPARARHTRHTRTNTGARIHVQGTSDKWWQDTMLTKCHHR